MFDAWSMRSLLEMSPIFENRKYLQGITIIDLP